MSNAVETVRLVKTDAQENNNKFYDVRLLSNGDVETRWGRVGATRGQSKTYPGEGASRFEQLVRSKENRGYRKVRNETLSAGQTSATTAVHAAARNELVRDGDTVTDELVRMLAAANRHAITLTSGGLITSTKSGGVQSALGPISPAAVAEARTVLDRAAQGSIGAVDQYLMLVPQVMPRQRGWAAQFTDARFLASQREFLDQLDAAVTVAAGVTDARADFRYKLVALDDDHRAVAKLRKRFAATMSPVHEAAALRLHRVWELTDSTAHSTWTATRKRLGNVRELWHGTMPQNVLSILHRGLYVPPTSGSSINITGRMFGDGVYLSDHATKSLNYSYGVWSRSSAREKRCFMFSAEAAMGRELETTAADSPSGVVRRMASGQYDSLFVKAGTCSVWNNEMIVPTADQLRLRYLCEFRV